MFTLCSFHRMRVCVKCVARISRPRASHAAVQVGLLRRDYMTRRTLSTLSPPPQQHPQADVKQETEVQHAVAGPIAATAPTCPPFDWGLLFKERKEWKHEAELVSDLRSDHAGETGAVYIYEGAKQAMAMRPARFSMQAHDFVRQHLATERAHLDLFERLLDPAHRSRLISLWRVAGFGLGFLPTFLGDEAGLFVTVEAVEAFVEKHYLEQVVPLERRGVYPELRRLLQQCCDEEVHHKEDARSRWLVEPRGKRPWLAVAWAKIVEAGSASAVAVCRRL